MKYPYDRSQVEKCGIENDKTILQKWADLKRHAVSLFNQYPELTAYSGQIEYKGSIAPAALAGYLDLDCSDHLYQFLEQNRDVLDPFLEAFNTLYAGKWNKENRSIQIQLSQVMNDYLCCGHKDLIKAFCHQPPMNPFDKEYWRALSIEDMHDGKSKGIYCMVVMCSFQLIERNPWLFTQTSCATAVDRAGAPPQHYDPYGHHLEDIRRCLYLLRWLHVYRLVDPTSKQVKKHGPSRSKTSVSGYKHQLTGVFKPAPSPRFLDDQDKDEAGPEVRPDLALSQHLIRVQAGASAFRRQAAKYAKPHESKVGCRTGPLPDNLTTAQYNEHVLARNGEAFQVTVDANGQVQTTTQEQAEADTDGTEEVATTRPDICADAPPVALSRDHQKILMESIYANCEVIHDGFVEFPRQDANIKSKYGPAADTAYCNAMNTVIGTSVDSLAQQEQGGGADLVIRLARMQSRLAK